MRRYETYKRLQKRTKPRMFVEKVKARLDLLLWVVASRHGRQSAVSPEGSIPSWKRNLD